MKRSSRLLAMTSAVIVIGGVMLHLRGELQGWRIHLPTIDGKLPTLRQPAAVVAPVAPVKPPIAGNMPDRRAPGAAAPRIPAAADPPPPKQRNAKDPEAGAPFWCFRTFFTGMPWMMNTDERNTGNAAHSDTQFIWNGERSVRLDIQPLVAPPNAPLRTRGVTRNVFWQAIRADAFRGKRITYRAALRAMPGGVATAFLRVWDGSNGAPLLAMDPANRARTPTIRWSAAWGRAELFLDIPVDAKFIYYGIVQSGNRPVWIDHVEINSDPVPGVLGTQGNIGESLENLPPLPIDPNWVWESPRNLDFETVYPEEGEEVENTPPLPC